MSFKGTVLVTGGTSGLGYHCALNIARQHPEYLVVVASRSDRDSAAASINKALNQDNVVFLPLDLSSLQNIRAFVQNWETKKYAPIQTLVLNAALQFPGGVRKTEDGIEATFAITHVGHALLFHLLFPHLSHTARIVVTASGTHDPAKKTGLHAKYTTAEELAHPTPESAKSSGRDRYASSKLANVLWTYALHRRLQKLEGKNMTVAGFDPGLMPGTGLARDANPIVRFLFLHVLTRLVPLLRALLSPNVHLPQESGANLAWLATTAEDDEMNGYYFEGKKKITSSVVSYDESKQEDLWNWTVKNIALNEEEARSFDM